MSAWERKSASEAEPKVADSSNTSGESPKRKSGTALKKSHTQLEVHSLTRDTGKRGKHVDKDNKLCCRTMSAPELPVTSHHAHGEVYPAGVTTHPNPPRSKAYIVDYSQYPGSAPAPGDQVVVTTSLPVTPPTQTVIVTQGSMCSNCRTGIIAEEYTCVGLLLAIFFFPVGLLCCWLMRQRICTTCGVVYPRAP